MTNNIQTVAESLLGRALKSNDGMSASEVETAQSLCKCAFPETLNIFYRLLGNVSMFMSSFQNFIEPYRKGDYLVFLEENQGICYWGVNIHKASDDGVDVYMCTDINAERLEWYPEEITLKEFMIVIMYYQCAQGGYQYGSAVYKSDFEHEDEYLAFLKDVTEGWIKAVNHNGLVIYIRNTALIWHFLNEDGSVGDIIFASSLKKKEIKELEKYGFDEL